MLLSPLLLSCFALGNALLLPDPSGPFGTALKVERMPTNYVDPYDPKHGERELLASIYWPVDKESCEMGTVSYMPPATAEVYGQQAAALGFSNDTFKAFEVQYCSTSVPSACKTSCTSKKPNAMAQSLASYGTVVVLIDHPYDATIVEFPHGTVIRGGDIPEDNASLEKAVQVRAKDISFVVSRIRNRAFQRTVFKRLPSAIDTSKIIALGHSLGGASAAAAVLSDTRIRGGVNLDGGLFNPALSKGLKKPFMQLGRTDHRSEETTWVVFWENLKGPKIELQVNGTVHGSFTDYPILLGALDLPEGAKNVTAPLFGTIDGQQVQQLISETLTAFAGYSFGSSAVPLKEIIRASKELSIVKGKLPSH